MANSDKDILITPNTGQTSEPTIEFTGADNTPLTLRVLDDGTVSFEGTAGQLFSVSDGLSGTIFSVNDISGIPSIEVLDDGTVKLAEYNGTVTAPTPTAGNNSTQVATTAFVTTAIDNAGGGSGTVTSVAMTVPTGLSISGSPITTSGTLAISLSSGYTIPTTAALDAKAPLASPTFTGTVTAATLDLTTAATATTASHYWVATGSDGIVRPKTLANVKSEILSSAALTGTPTAPTAAVDTNTTQIATTAYVVGQGYLKSSSYTASDVLTKIKTVDGAASGLDSDLLDGQHGSYYLDWTNTTNKPDPTITLGGDASGSLTLTDLAGGTLTVTVADDSHNHIISNVDGLQTALNDKAPLASPALSGTPTAPTAASGTNTTQIATTEFVTSALSGVTGGASYQTTAPTSPTVGQIWVDSDETYTTINPNDYALKTDLGASGFDPFLLSGM